MPDSPNIPRRSLVTGGAGFIGSHLVERLVARGDRVTVVDDLSTGRESNLAAVAGSITLLRGDVSEVLGAMPETESFDELYHLAAAVGVRLVLEDPIGSIETNVGGTAAALHFAQTHGRPRTLIASSSEVYGKPNTGVFSEEDDSLYGPTTTTRWSYAAAKALDEHLALAYDRLRDVPTTVCRFFNTVGPRQVGEYGMVVPGFVAAALKNEPLTVYGDGEQSRCFCDVRDVADALPRILAAPGSRGRVLNLGSDTPITIGELAELVIETLGSGSAVTRVPYADAYPAGFEDLRQRRPDLARVRELIGFSPTIPLTQTVRDLAAQMSPTPGASAGRGDA